MLKTGEAKVQEMTNSYTTNVEEILSTKEADIMKV